MERTKINKRRPDFAHLKKINLNEDLRRVEVLDVERVVVTVRRVPDERDFFVRDPGRVDVGHRLRVHPILALNRPRMTSNNNLGDIPTYLKATSFCYSIYNGCVVVVLNGLS